MSFDQIFPDRHFKLLIILLTFSLGAVTANAQTEPPQPLNCNTSGKFELTVTGSPSFTFNSYTDFSVSQSLNTLNINVKSNSGSYRVYIAGEIISPTSLPNTPIPIGTFSVSATNPGTGPVAPFPLTGNGSYQLLAQGGSTTGKVGRDHQVTLTRGVLNSFTQAPGDHALYLHIRICQD